MATGPDDIHRKLVELIDVGRTIVLATVLFTEGSTPQRAGAKAAIDAAGHLWGTVGGGAVEAETQRIAIEACQSQRPVVFDFQMHSDDAAAAGAICGGHMRILVDPTAATHRLCYAAAAQAVERRQRGVLLTTISSGPEMKVQVEWLTEEAISGRTTFPDRPQRFVENSPAGEGLVEFFVEPVVPRPLLLVAGGGHVGQALAALAVQIGFDVTVIDDRPEFANPALFPPGVNVCCGSAPEQIAAQPLDKDTYVVLVTRGHRHDAEALAACIHKRPAYLGMIGSRRKVALIRQHFLENGLATEGRSIACSPPWAWPSAR